MRSAHDLTKKPPPTLLKEEILMKNRLLATLAAVLAAAAVVAATPGTAQAATPTPANINGKSPYSMNCTNDARTIYTKTVYNPRTGKRVGTLQMRYSNYCHAAWAKVSNIADSNDAGWVRGRIVSDSNDNVYECRAGTNISGNYSSGCYSPMVWDKGLRAHAEWETYTGRYSFIVKTASY